MKKFPSIVKLPRHQKFSYAPRFYDPVKEDIDNRTALIKSSLRHEKKLSDRNPEEAAQYRNRISMAYNRRGQMERKSSLTQVVIAVGLIVLFVVFFLY